MFEKQTVLTVCSASGLLFKAAFGRRERKVYNLVKENVEGLRDLSLVVFGMYSLLNLFPVRD